MGALNGSDLEQLEYLMDLKFRKKQQSFFRILSEEEKLRAQLAQLETMETANSDAKLQEMRHIGADVIWKAWLNRTRSKLNLSLAQVLAQKEMLRDTARKDYAKVSIAETLATLQKSDERKTQQAQQLSDAIIHHQIRRLYQSE